MKESLALPLLFNHDVYTNQAKDFERIYLLLHGYLLDGAFMFDKLKNILLDKSLILAPNGPFVVPQKKGDSYLAKYSWYFFDPHTKAFYINYEPAAHFLKTMLEHYNAFKKPVTIIGYSQGGYLSAKVAELITEVDSVVGMACVFRNEKFQYRSNVSYHQIHGNLDGVVEMTSALDEWAILKEKGNNGTFIELAEIGHRLTSEYFTALKDLIKND